MRSKQLVTTSTEYSRPRRKASRSVSASISTALISDRARFLALVIFVFLAAFLGGSSRADVPGLVMLRPLSVLLCVYALLVASREQLRGVSGALMLVGFFMGLALFQLVPLPSGMWGSLPGRELAAEAGDLAGLADVWRPLSVDPNRTWNAFFALFIPLTAICLVAVQDSRSQHRILLLLLGVGLISVALAVLQAIGARSLHLYQITHSGFPVGLFANRNHQATLLLWLMLAASFLAATADLRRLSAKTAVSGALAMTAMIIPLLILTGSRTGLVLSVSTMAVCAWLLFRAPPVSAFLQRGGRRARLVLFGAAAVAVGLVVFVGITLGFSTRRTALTRLFDLSAGEDLRALYFPRFLEMIGDYFPAGSGLGSFEVVFNMYEPVQHLTPRYMNQAHNDPIQLLIEGGLPAAVFIVAGLFWIGCSSLRIWRSRSDAGKPAAVFYCGSIALWLAASVVDYPLRTPLGAMVFAALTAQLAILSTRGHSNTAAVDGRG